MPQEEIDATFEQINTSKSGKITYEEIDTGVRRLPARQNVLGARLVAQLNDMNDFNRNVARDALLQFKPSILARARTVVLGPHLTHPWERLAFGSLWRPLRGQRSGRCGDR